ncbi:COX15/CtaA family protein [Hartmannibacter diazotrophicus]|nr:COX15/CtaA family protein [Hartmannibacter diazotrophicus]
MASPTAFASSNGSSSADETARARRAVRIWLWTIAIFIVAMVIVGGATRMTESGLSITEWKPIHGVIPPLSEAEWQEEFLKYQKIPQYSQMNADMTLSGFKTIFWWEWAHRLLGRSIGLVFIVPFAVFAMRGWIRGGMLPRIGVLFVLGGLQGAVGWWMVASGLVERTEVSQYRLAIHLTFACAILAATVWIAEGYREGRFAIRENHALRRFAGFLVLLVLGQIFLGGLVAGLRAGLIYNTWPLMDGSLLPDGLWTMAPAWLNFFENHKTVQFVHRLGAYTVLAMAILHYIQAHGEAMASETIRRSGWLVLAIMTQAVIGIVTLLLVVPIELGLLHQAAAVGVLVLATAHWRRLSPPTA